MTVLIGEHDEECVLEGEIGKQDGPCEPKRGVWNQPPSWEVSMAIGELERSALFVSEVPWCQINLRAWELADGGEDE